MTHQAEQDPVFEYGVSLLRTAAPSIWGWIGTELVSLGVQLPDAYGPTAVTVVLAVAWYAIWHKIEHLLPAWATRLVLGANTAPRYSAPPAGTSSTAAAISVRPSDPNG